MWIHVPSERNVELSLAVHPVEPVEAGVVEEDHAGGPLHRVEITGIHLPDAVVIFLVVYMDLERLDELVHPIANGAVAFDELPVGVRERRLPGDKIEEYRATAHERLVIAAIGWWIEIAQPFENLALPTYPLEKRFCPVSFCHLCCHASIP